MEGSGREMGGVLGGRREEGSGEGEGGGGRRKGAGNKENGKACWSRRHEDKKRFELV